MECNVGDNVKQKQFCHMISRARGKSFYHDRSEFLLLNEKPTCVLTKTICNPNLSVKQCLCSSTFTNNSETSKDKGEMCFGQYHALIIVGTVWSASLLKTHQPVVDARSHVRYRFTCVMQHRETIMPLAWHLQLPDLFSLGHSLA